MRYTIEGFSQRYALTLRKTFEVRGKMVERKIDCTDLVILRWFVDFYPEMKKIEVDGVQYAWLTHKKLAEDLPIVDITKKAFIERMQKLVDFEILTYKLVKEGGTFSLYGFGKNYKNMVSEREYVQTDTVSVQTDTGCTVEQPTGVRSNGYGVDVQTDNKDISIKDTSIKDNSIKDKKHKESADTLPSTNTKKNKSKDNYSIFEEFAGSNTELLQALKDFLDMRKLIKKPMSERAMTKLIKELQKLSDNADVWIEILEQSILNNWQSVYALKDNKGGVNGGSTATNPTQSGGNEWSRFENDKFCI